MEEQTTSRVPDASRVVAEWVADAASQTDTGSYLGRRRSLRYVWPGPMAVRVDAHASLDKRFFATGVDVSAVGMALLSRRKLPAGASVFLRYADDDQEVPWVPASVVYSKRSVSGWRVAVRFQSDPTA